MSSRANTKKIRNINNKIVLPENVSHIIHILEERGFEAYAVGGCIRDSLIDRMPGDWDITTSALPMEIKSAFRRTVDTGIKHGTVTVLIGDEAYEVTTYRIDGEYTDMRHPSGVEFTKVIGEDLKRRDFTINAMAYNDRTGVLDMFGGIADLERRVIRCVGNPDERFNEDALRILRAVRFAAQLDYDIDSMTRDAIANHAPNLKAVSKERILTEMTKLVCSAHIERTADIFQLGMVPYIAKNFRKVNIAQLMSLADYARQMRKLSGGRSFTAPEYDLGGTAPAEKRYVRFAFLAEGMEQEQVNEMLSDLKSDNVTRKNAALLAGMVLKSLPADRYELKKIMSGMSPELFMDLLNMKLVSHESMLYKIRCADERLPEVLELYNDIAVSGDPVYPGDLVLTGSDIIKAGIAEGPEIGRLRGLMHDDILRCPQHNSREYLTQTYLM